MKEMSLMKGNEAAFAWSLGEAYGVEPNEKTRMDFLHEERGGLYAAGSDPLGQLEFIDRAKEPFRFAQLCMDWACFQDNPWYKTGTIHWLDQTCSGWGHVLNALTLSIVIRCQVFVTLMAATLVTSFLP